MRFWALFAVPLILALDSNPVQRVPDVPVGAPAQNEAPQNSGSATMSPRQIAEMRAEILMARKEYAEAAAAYQHLLEQTPGNAEILNKVGMAYEQLGEASLAEHFFKKAVKADKNSSHALNNLGTLEYAPPRQHYGKAIKYYKKAIETGGDLAPVYSNLGYAYCAIKQYPQAMDAFGKALALDPNVFEPKSGPGSILQQRSAVDPGALYFMVAKSYAKTGDAERTARYLKLARDDGYKDLLAAEKDPDFVRVIKDPQVQNVLRLRPAYDTQSDKPVTN